MRAIATKLSTIELRKEIANSLTHGLGLLFGIVAIPILIATAASTGNVKGIVGASIYGFSFLMVFGFTTTINIQPITK